MFSKSELNQTPKFWKTLWEDPRGQNYLQYFYLPIYSVDICPIGEKHGRVGHSLRNNQDSGTKLLYSEGASFT